MKVLRSWWLWMGLAAVTVLAFWIRFNILNHQPRRISGELPFTMESALHFRRIQQVMDDGRLQAQDPRIFYPVGISVWKTYTVLDEYLYAWGSRILPSWMPLTERVRLVQIGWFCMSVLALGLWIALWSRSRAAGLCAAAWYAVMAPSVLRSSGIELSRENGAFPFMFAFLALDEAAGKRSRWAPVLAAASGVFAGLAMCAWDLSQFLLALWIIREVWNIRRSRKPASREDLWRIGGLTLGLLAAGLSHPYLRSHAFPVSPLMGAFYGLFIYQWMSRYGFLRRGSRAAVALVPLTVTMCIAQTLMTSYGHFAGLLWAKIRFLNIKPADPAMLTFDQRIMWVPALHSADFGIIKMLFIYTLPLTLLLSGGMLTAQVRSERKDPVFYQLLFFFVFSFAAFVLFVRFYVFVAVFMAALLGWVLTLRPRRSIWLWLAAALIAAGWAGETLRVFNGAKQWGRTHVYYEESEDLTDWLKTRIPDEPVCANFGISGSILTYAGCPIVLHPKFEKPDIRRRVRRYAETLYRGEEQDFRAFMSGVQCRWYVHSMGSFARRRPEWQMRYFVDALEPSTNAPAWNFEYRPGRLRYFDRVYANPKYAVYRMLTKAEEQAAAERAAEAAAAFERGELATAEVNAVAALKQDGRNERAIELIRMIDALKEKGFSYERETAEP